jgi:hypothetical protein
MISNGNERRFMIHLTIFFFASHLCFYNFLFSSLFLPLCYLPSSLILHLSVFFPLSSFFVFPLCFFPLSFNNFLISSLFLQLSFLSLFLHLCYLLSSLILHLSVFFLLSSFFFLCFSSFF